MRNRTSIWIKGMRLLCLLLFLNSCTSTTEKNSDIVKANEEKAAPSLYTVEIKQMKFFPEVLNVHPGDTVVWINNDIVVHDVTEEKNKAWSSSPLAPGKSWRMVVTADADYYCSIHQVMKGKLLLE